MKKLTFKTSILSLTALCGLTLTLGSCANEDIAQNGNGTDNDKTLTIFSTGEEPATRTSMESNGTFYWEAGDKIWVKDDNGAWQQSSNSPSGKTASFRFAVPGKFTKTNTYQVYYSGQNGNQNQVTISANQTQTEPNSTAHFGTSGDCGTATAAWSTTEKGYSFQLNHQAAYLIFQPYTSNTVLQSCYLTKIEVTSDDDISDRYILNLSTGSITGTGNGNQIILTTKGSGPYINGFPLTNSSASVTTNGAYMVIKPGTHTLRIRYWLKDIVTAIEGTITKVLSSTTFSQNKYYNITANLDVRNYDGNHYYMWDAQDQYWKGYEWTKNLPSGTGQPTRYLYGSSNYPKNTSDTRYCNPTYPGRGIRYDAQTSIFQTLPNANEMSWYVMFGDPCWDNNELWTTMGHLYKSGVWIKKRSVLRAEGHYDTEISADGVTDLRPSVAMKSYTKNVSRVLPSVARANDYFFLPTLGYYMAGSLQSIGHDGSYWTSSSGVWNVDNAYSLYFNDTYFNSYTSSRRSGNIVQVFE